MTEAAQGTDAWLLARSGKWTGSEFVNVLARNRKGEPAKAYHDLIWQIVVERMTGRPEVGPSSFSLRWGHDVEPYAREAVEIDTGYTVQTSEFIQHPKYPFVGCSPDGLIGEDGGLEMKSPKSSSVHLIRFIEGMPEEFRPQVQGSMWVTGRKWWLWVSYDPRMPESYRLFKLRIARDEAYIKNLEHEVMRAEMQVQDIINRLIKRAA